MYNYKKIKNLIFKLLYYVFNYLGLKNISFYLDFQITLLQNILKVNNVIIINIL